VQAAAETPSADGQPLTFGEVIRSPLMMQLGGMLCGVLLLLSFVGIYVGMMKGAGRALDASWKQKTIAPVDVSDPRMEFGSDFEKLSRGPCEVRSLNAKFRELQKELGC
jgi:hypothetical protein